MDLQELTTNHPDLVEQIRNEAIETAHADNDKAVMDALAADGFFIHDTVRKMVIEQAGE